MSVPETQISQAEKTSEERQSPAEVLANYKRAVRRNSVWAVLFGGVVLAFHVVLLMIEGNSLWLVFQSIWFLFGLLILGFGLFSFYQSSRFTIEDLKTQHQAQVFAEYIESVKPLYTYILLGCIIAVFFVQAYLEKQLLVMFYKSAQIAGLDKPRVWDGETWRLLTSAVLHGNIVHIFFNGQALLGLGRMVEALSNRAHVPIVFLLAALVGNFASLCLMPEVLSVGASGGILGIFGFLAVYGYRRKHQLPPDFLRTMLVNIGFIAAFGLVANQFVNNIAHLGGLLVGLIYGLFQIPRDGAINPRAIGWLTEATGYLALGFFVFISIFTLLLLLKVIIL